jgi:hypothetical protein
MMLSFRASDALEVLDFFSCVGFAMCSGAKEFEVAPTSIEMSP